MKPLILQPTPVAHWHALVNQAEYICKLELDEEIESYLVFLLMRFCKQTNWVKSILAVEFLEGVNQPSYQRQATLKEIGDKCLLISGFFPQLAQRRRVSKNYITDLGQSAFDMAACASQESLAKLFFDLSRAFKELKEILHIIRFEQKDLV